MGFLKPGWGFKVRIGMGDFEGRPWLGSSAGVGCGVKNRPAGAARNEKPNPEAAGH